MRNETTILTGIVAFLAAVSLIYWFTSYENTGTALLAFSALAYLFLGGYLLFVRRRLRAPRPEDKEKVAPGEGAGAVGYFPAVSVWPPAMGIGAFLIGLGLVYGLWFLIPGAIVMVGALIGYAVEAEARD